LDFFADALNPLNTNALRSNAPFTMTADSRRFALALSRSGLLWYSARTGGLGFA